MTSAWKIATVLALVLGVVGIGALFLGGSGSKQLLGDVVPNAQWFTSGYGFGTLSSLYLSDKLTLAAGQNQAAWQNNTGNTVTIDMGRFDLTGTASSTFAVWVGTSTASTATNVFSLSTAPFWAQLIGGSNTVATGTPGTYTTQLDNFVNHKSGYPAEIQILSGQYLLVVADSFCLADGACNTATSSQRGWTASIPFIYHYAGLR